jgi:two-component system sensor histidine kinase UhpB
MLAADTRRGLQVRALSLRLVNAAESERHGLTRELHDRVGQSLTALNFTLNRLAGELPEDAPSRTRECLRESLQLVEATAESIQDVMVDLRPPLLDDHGLLAALRWYADLFARRTGIAVTVSGAEPDRRLRREVEMTLYRIAQEALTNVAKHARTRRATIDLELQHGHLTLTVADEGAGLPPPASAFDLDPRWGIVSMRERAQAVGGALRIESFPGAGTRVIAEVGHPL